MRLNKPSYGVFMVDVFASSVGIFILVSLLYIIESAKATSNEAMVDRFKTLVKRDLVPVDRYSLPVLNDPLHDWGVRARHAREKQEALILLLRDRVLLYHTNETVALEDIVDSEVIAQYYQKYSKRRRLFLEIHYHDAYHNLKAKIHQALPPNVHLWIHWAYNAGNLNNPNPVMSNAARPNINLSKGDPNAPVGDGNGVASSTSDGGSLSGDGGTPGTDPNGSEGGKGATTGQPQGSADGTGEGTSGDGAEANGQPNGTADGSADATGTDEGNWPQSDEDSSDANADGEGIPEDVKSEVAKQLNQSLSEQKFTERFMTPQDEQSRNTSKNRKKAKQQPPKLNEQEQSSASKNRKSSPNKDDLYKGLKRKNNQQSNNKPSDQAQQDEQPTSEMAETHIKKNVFLAVPLYSPVYNFRLDVRVPGFAQQRFNLNGVGLNLHHSAEQDSQTTLITLAHGDTILPQGRKYDPSQQSSPPGWIQVKVIQVKGTTPKIGWLYGFVSGEVFMLPLFENTVQSFATDDYWFKRNDDTFEAFDIAPVKQENR